MNFRFAKFTKPSFPGFSPWRLRAWLLRLLKAVVLHTYDEVISNEFQIC